MTRGIFTSGGELWIGTGRTAEPVLYVGLAAGSAAIRLSPSACASTPAALLGYRPAVLKGGSRGALARVLEVVIENGVQVGAHESVARLAPIAVQLRDSSHCSRAW